MLGSKDAHLVIRSGMKMFELRNHEYAMRLLSKADLIGMAGPLRARAISNVYTGHYTHAYRDFQRYFHCRNTHVDPNDTEMIRCLIDVNMFMHDYKNASKVLRQVMETNSQKFMPLWAKCLFEMGYYCDAMLAVIKVDGYEKEPHLCRILTDCEENIKNAQVIKTYFGKDGIRKDECQSVRVEKEAHELLDLALRNQ